MTDINVFFRKVFSNPSLLWKGGASLIFIVLSFIIAFVPSVTGNIASSSRYSFAFLLVVYGLFRGYTFYSEYKTLKDE